FLLMPSGRREANGFCDGVVHRGRAAGDNAVKSAAQQFAIACPALDEDRTVSEPIEKDFIVRPEQIVEKAPESGLRLPDPFTGHAAARIEGDPETHRDALRAEV